MTDSLRPDLVDEVPLPDQDASGITAGDRAYRLAYGDSHLRWKQSGDA